MYDLERQNKILEILREKKSISVDKLTKLIYVSPATVRRDLNQMEKRGLVTRTFGGVLLAESPNEESSVLFRERASVREKRKICDLCANLIKDNSSLFLDSSTTISYLIPLLKDFKRLNVITNGLKTALSLSQHTSARVILTSGYLNARSASVIGNMTIDTLSKFYCDYAIMSCSALNLDFGFMESTVDQAEMKLKMIANCATSIMLCDSSKFDKKELFQIGPLKSVDYLITDQLPSDDYVNALESEGVKLLY